MKSLKAKSSSDKKSTMIPAARCTPSQKIQFDQLVLGSGMNNTSYILECCLQHKPRAIVTEAAIDTYRELTQLRGQLNKIKGILANLQCPQPQDVSLTIPADLLNQTKEIIDQIEIITKRGQREAIMLDEVPEEEEDEFDQDEADEFEP